MAITPVLPTDTPNSGRVKFNDNDLELDTRLQVVEGTSTSFDTRLDTLEGQNLNARLTASETDIDNLQSADTSLNTRVTIAEADITSLEAADTSLDTRLDTLEGVSVPALQAADTSLDARLDTLEAQSLNTRLTAAETDVGNLQAASTSLNTRVTAAETDIDNLQATDVSLNTRVTTAETDIDNLQSADTSLDARLDTLEGQSLNTRLTAAETDINNLEAADVSIDTRLDALEAASGGVTNLATTLAASSVTITSDTGADATIPAATTTNAGVLSSSDKTKLDGIATGANAYVHPNHTGDVTSVADGATTIANNAVSNAKAADMPANTFKGNNTANPADPIDLTVAQAKALLAYTVPELGGQLSDVQHGGRGGGSLHALATTTVAGFMSAADKSRHDTNLTAQGIKLSSFTVATLPTGLGTGDAGTEIYVSDMVTSKGTGGQATWNGSSWRDSDGNVVATSFTSFPATHVEAVQDIVGALIVDSASIDATYNDVANTLTLVATPNSTTQRLELAKAATLVGTRKQINFIEGANTTIGVVDDAANDRVNITITSAAGGSGSGLTHAQSMSRISLGF